MSDWAITAGTSHDLGAHHDGDGVNFAVFSENAEKIELCLFSPDGRTEIARLTLPERSGSIWHGHISGLPVGTPYGYRAHGPYAPEQGHRFNANKLLLDPYTRELCGNWTNGPALFGYDVASSDADLSFGGLENNIFVSKSLISAPQTFPRMKQARDVQDGRDLIYEAHAKGLTQQNTCLPEKLRGTYEGLASDAMIAHLQSLNISAIELLPVHSFIDDAFLTKRGLTNYWGYNTVGFFAPEPRYFGPAGVLGFQQMVRKFHAAGIRVILDVVYNHTGEGDHLGRTLCFRGLDNASYYRLNPDNPRFYINDTGTGNTLNLSHPMVMRMVMDSLRFWVEHMGIDGFRFDLGTTLAREATGFNQNGGFLNALRQDPVLRTVRLIAEPWDIGPGGYQLGNFPAEFGEWNDQYRDTLRRFWRGDRNSAQGLGACLLGSADVFDTAGRKATSSINFISAHDGFTLADTVAYVKRHNEANTEGNRDGHHTNFSDNCGVEGVTDDPLILQKRQQRQRNMLATQFLSQGTPMLLGGDEFGNSQDGNNNAYCQDNPIGWVNWQSADADLLAFTQKLTRFRTLHAALRQPQFLHGARRGSDGLQDVEWADFDGKALMWNDPNLSQICMTVRSQDVSDNDTVIVAINRSDQDGIVTLPPGISWRKGIDTALTPDVGLTLVKANSVVAFVPEKSPE